MSRGLVGRRSAPLLLLAFVLGVVMVMVAATMASGAPPGETHPPGNNGTIKIDDVEFDDHPNNEPHVGCIFEVDFYGYDEGDLDARVTFRIHPPTGRDKILLRDWIDIGEDPAGGGTDLDAHREYDLSPALAEFTPHPKHGYHVKLVVNAEGSIGADTKHKVFWVQGCDEPPPPPPTTTTTTEDPGGTE